MLQELDIPYIKVNFSSPPPEWYLATIQATGLSLIPSIRDCTGLTLSDSNSICIYLAHKYRDKGLWSKNPVHVGQALMWAGELKNTRNLNARGIHSDTNYTLFSYLIVTHPLRRARPDFVENYWATPRFNPVFHACVNGIYPPSTGKPGKPSDEEIASATKKSVDCLLILEEHLKRQSEMEQSYLVSEKFTFVDALTAPWLHREYRPRRARDHTFTSVCLHM